jgi:hypothetical protein
MLKENMELVGWPRRSIHDGQSGFVLQWIGKTLIPLTYGS